jgi:hypothetical protein
MIHERLAQDAARRIARAQDQYIERSFGHEKALGLFGHQMAWHDITAIIEMSIFARRGMLELRCRQP